MACCLFSTEPLSELILTLKCKLDQFLQWNFSQQWISFKKINVEILSVKWVHFLLAALNVLTILMMTEFSDAYMHHQVSISWLARHLLIWWFIIINDLIASSMFIARPLITQNELLPYHFIPGNKQHRNSIARYGCVLSGQIQTYLGVLL